MKPGPIPSPYQIQQQTPPCSVGLSVSSGGRRSSAAENTFGLESFYAVTRSLWLGCPEHVLGAFAHNGGALCVRTPDTSVFAGGREGAWAACVARSAIVITRVVRETHEIEVGSLHTPWRHALCLYVMADVCARTRTCLPTCWLQDVPAAAKANFQNVPDSMFTLFVLMNGEEFELFGRWCSTLIFWSLLGMWRLEV